MGKIDGHGNIHSSAGAPGAGQFTGKVNARPAGTLDPTSWPREGAADDVTGLRGPFADRLKSDADLGRAIEVMERQGIDFRVYDPNASQIASMVKDAIFAERWRDTPQSGSINEFDLRDVTVMGGDEIRAMTPRQRQHLLSQSVQAAQRLQDYMRELDEDPDEQTGHLEVVDYRNLTPKNVTDVWFAARDQHGARGIWRDRSDFLAHVTDMPDLKDVLGENRELTESELECAWQHYLNNHAGDYEEGIASEREYQVFTGLVENSLRATQ